jgi:D-glycero-D-manno-heptose 1,7-bisphosphate phosphatase
MAARRAIFVDRDGTLSHEVGYVNHLSRFRLFPFAASAVRAINNSGFLAVVVTNQAGVARGYFESLVGESMPPCRPRSGRRRAAGRLLLPHHPSAGDPPYRKETCKPRQAAAACRGRAQVDLTRSWGGDRGLAVWAVARAIWSRPALWAS